MSMDYHFNKTVPEHFEDSNCERNLFSEASNTVFHLGFYCYLGRDRDLFKMVNLMYFISPPQILVDEFPSLIHLVVDKDENAVIVVLFCSTLNQERRFGNGKHFGRKQTPTQVVTRQMKYRE
ncbi:hypothetical protein CEXT_196911 [Caerostris extrusa]|uniref:Uncharacterized protein n=1 Tax=Caerostris extrusa TaxID=172846 RepID=A0AAV4Q8G9_CAEEX|nr:hypothetical protein CEXT_196911 [Caerostris extrusa]